MENEIFKKFILNNISEIVKAMESEDAVYIIEEFYISEEEFMEDLESIAGKNANIYLLEEYAPVLKLVMSRLYEFIFGVDFFEDYRSLVRHINKTVLSLLFNNNKKERVAWSDYVIEETKDMDVINNLMMLYIYTMSIGKGEVVSFENKEIVYGDDFVSTNYIDNLSVSKIVWDVVTTSPESLTFQNESDVEYLKEEDIDDSYYLSDIERSSLIVKSISENRTQLSVKVKDESVIEYIKDIELRGVKLNLSDLQYEVELKGKYIEGGSFEKEYS